MSADNPTYNLISLKALPENICAGDVLVHAKQPIGHTTVSTPDNGKHIYFNGVELKNVQIYRTGPGSGSLGPGFNGVPNQQIHHWLAEDGLIPYLRIMRGEDRLPHTPNNCDECHKIFRAQISLLSENGMGNGLGPGKRHKKKNPGRQKMQARMDRIRGRLQILAQHEAHHEHRH